MSECLYSIIALGGRYLVLKGFRVVSVYDLEEAALVLAGHLNGLIIGCDAQPEGGES